MCIRLTLCFIGDYLYSRDLHTTLVEIYHLAVVVVGEAYLHPPSPPHYHPVLLTKPHRLSHIDHQNINDSHTSRYTPQQSAQQTVLRNAPKSQRIPVL